MSTARPISVALASTLTLPAAAHADAALSLDGIRFEALDADTALAAVETKTGVAIAAVGKHTAVGLCFDDTEAPSEVSFGIEHTDAGTHAFQLAGGADEGSWVLGFHCDAVDPLEDTGASWVLGFHCNAVDGLSLTERDGAWLLELQCNGIPGSATVHPRFAGIERYSLRVVRDGKVVLDAKGLDQAVTIPDFEDPAAQGRETLWLTMAYGEQRPDAWTFTLHHDEWTISITPDGKQERDAVRRTSLRTAGLGEIALVDATVQ